MMQLARHVACTTVMKYIQKSAGKSEEKRPALRVQTRNFTGERKRTVEQLHVDKQMR